MLTLAVSAAVACASHSPPSGVPGDGHLRPCPPTPNCVASDGAEPAHSVSPIAYAKGREHTARALRGAILAEPRARLVDEQANYWRATFTSLLFRFVDDSEFIFDDAAQVVRIRSSSRIGRYDFGANRRRLARIAQRVAAAP
ncbi:MAG: DUF1499 domain-containing protein [Gemmatimonadaceae bacterium]